MKKTALLFTVLGLSITMAGHAMEVLPDTDLQNIDGQAGADLNLYLSLNHKPVSGNTDNTLLAAYDPARTPQFDTSSVACPSDKLEYCRLAISFNNRTVDADGNPTGTNNGKKQWITFKGVQGTINIQKLGLDGTSVSYIPQGGSSAVNKAAVMLSFDASKPTLIRNFGFQSLAIETDSKENEAAGNVAGYLNPAKYGTTDGAFDANNPFTGTARERGFLGVNMNTNLALTGTIKMFSCASSGSVAHPRC